MIGNDQGSRQRDGQRRPAATDGEMLTVLVDGAAVPAGRKVNPSERDGSSDQGLTRRRALTAAGAAAAWLAGCTAGDVTPGDTTGSPASPQATTPRATTGTPTGGEPATDRSTATPPDPAALAKTFVARLSDEEYKTAAGMLGGALASSLDADSLQRYWRGLRAQHGTLSAVSVVGRSAGEDGTVLDLQLKCAQGRAPLRLTVDRAIVGLRWTASYSRGAYVDRSAFVEQSFRVPGERQLPGTLAVPTAEGTYPGVVLVHGTGAHDRDETIGPNKPLRDLAWGLASRGIAVARYDKVTEEYDIPPAERTLDRVTVDDAVMAAKRLAEREPVVDDAVFVVGHSQGGTAAPRIAEKHGALAGIAMLAGNARPITDVIIAQNRRLLRNMDGDLSERDESQLDRIKAVMEGVESRSYPEDKPIGNLTAALLYSFLDYDQIATARSLSVPTFVGQGGRDWQVGPGNYGLWMDALPASRTRGARYPSLNHLFQPGTSPSTRLEYAVFFDSVAETVVADLAAWIDASAP